MLSKTEGPVVISQGVTGVIHAHLSTGEDYANGSLGNATGGGVTAEFFQTGPDAAPASELWFRVGYMGMMFTGTDPVFVHTVTAGDDQHWTDFDESRSFFAEIQITCTKHYDLNYSNSPHRDLWMGYKDQSPAGFPDFDLDIYYEPLSAIFTFGGEGLTTVTTDFSITGFPSKIYSLNGGVATLAAYPIYGNTGFTIGGFWGYPDTVQPVTIGTITMSGVGSGVPGGTYTWLQSDMSGNSVTMEGVGFSYIGIGPSGTWDTSVVLSIVNPGYSQSYIIHKKDWNELTTSYSDWTYSKEFKGAWSLLAEAYGYLATSDDSDPALEGASYQGRFGLFDPHRLDSDLNYPFLQADIPSPDFPHDYIYPNWTHFSNYRVDFPSSEYSESGVIQFNVPESKTYATFNSTTGWSSDAGGDLSVDSGRLKFVASATSTLTKDYSTTFSLFGARYLQFHYTSNDPDHIIKIEISGRQYNMTSLGSDNYQIDLINPIGATGSGQQSDYVSYWDTPSDDWGVNYPGSIKFVGLVSGKTYYFTDLQWLWIDKHIYVEIFREPYVADTPDDSRTLDIYSLYSTIDGGLEVYGRIGVILLDGVIAAELFGTMHNPQIYYGGLAYTHYPIPFSEVYPTTHSTIAYDGEGHPYMDAVSGNPLSGRSRFLWPDSGLISMTINTDTEAVLLKQGKFKSSDSSYNISLDAGWYFTTSTVPVSEGSQSLETTKYIKGQPYIRTINTSSTKVPTKLKTFIYDNLSASGCTLNISHVASGIIDVTPTVNAAGSGYFVGDILTITGGGGNATVAVDTLTGNPGSGAATVHIISHGTSYSVTTGAATTGLADRNRPIPESIQDILIDPVSFDTIPSLEQNRIITLPLTEPCTASNTIHVSSFLGNYVGCRCYVGELAGEDDYGNDTSYTYDTIVSHTDNTITFAAEHTLNVQIAYILVEYKYILEVINKDNSISSTNFIMRNCNRIFDTMRVDVGGVNGVSSTVNAHGRIYLAILQSNYIHIKTSDDNGISWLDRTSNLTGSDIGLFSIEWEHYKDHPNLIIFFERGSNIVESRSIDEGLTFSTEVIIVSTASNPYAIVDTSNGMLLLYYYMSGNIYCKRSMDYGTTFIETAFIAISTVSQSTVSAEFTSDSEHAILLHYIDNAGNLQTKKSVNNGLTYS
jgi:hypothetical protein